MSTLGYLTQTRPGTAPNEAAPPMRRDHVGQRQPRPYGPFQTSTRCESTVTGLSTASCMPCTPNSRLAQGGRSCRPAVRAWELDGRPTNADSAELCDHCAPSEIVEGVPCEQPRQRSGHE